MTTEAFLAMTQRTVVVQATAGPLLPSAPVGEVTVRRLNRLRSGSGTKNTTRMAAATATTVRRWDQVGCLDLGPSKRTPV